MMNLNLSELQESRAATVISNLRKHKDVDLANSAKQLRTFWKETMMESVSHSHPHTSNASEAAPSATEGEAAIERANA